MDRHTTRSVGGTLSDTYQYLDTTETAWQTGNAAPTSSLLDADGSRLAIKTGTTVSWLVFDLHGSVVALCPAGTSTLADAYRFDGFGQQIASAGTATNPWRYRGLLNIGADSLTGALLDMNARDYSPQLGAFTQQDSVQGSAANPLSMNRFAYALANPATLIDPDGHMVPCTCQDPYYPAPPPPPRPPVTCNANLDCHGGGSSGGGGGSGGGGSAGGGGAGPQPPHGAAPVNDDGIGFHGYAPWQLAEDSFITSALDDAGLNCIGKDPDDPACVIMRSTQDWKSDMADLWCSIHRAMCDAWENAKHHEAFGWGSLAPVVGTPSALVDAKNYAEEGDWLGAFITVAGTATGLKLVGKILGFGETAAKGDVLVYRSVNALTGELHYVGITNDLARRSAQHLASPRHMTAQAIPGLSNLTRADAKAVEQVLINAYGGPKGRQLLNKINSIAVTNPLYAQAIGRGCALLIAASYPIPAGTC